MRTSNSTVNSTGTKQRGWGPFSSHSFHSSRASFAISKSFKKFSSYSAHSHFQRLMATSAMRSWFATTQYLAGWASPSDFSEELTNARTCPAILAAGGLHIFPHTCLHTYKRPRKIVCVCARYRGFSTIILQDVGWFQGQMLRGFGEKRKATYGKNNRTRAGIE